MGSEMCIRDRWMVCICDPASRICENVCICADRISVCNDTGLYAYQKDPDGSGIKKCGVEIAAVHIYCVTGNERFFVKIFGCIKNGIVLLLQ